MEWTLGDGLIVALISAVTTLVGYLVAMGGVREEARLRERMVDAEARAREGVERSLESLRARLDERSEQRIKLFEVSIDAVSKVPALMHAYRRHTEMRLAAYDEGTIRGEDARHLLAEQQRLDDEWFTAMLMVPPELEGPALQLKDTVVRLTGLESRPTEGLEAACGVGNSLGLWHVAVDRWKRAIWEQLGGPIADIDVEQPAKL